MMIDILTFLILGYPIFLTIGTVVIGLKNDFEIRPGQAFVKAAGLPLVPFRWLVSHFKPKTPLQKEIAEKRKEIEQLKQQKADMAELERLTDEESKLFEEVNDERKFVGVDPLPHLFDDKVFTPEETEEILRSDDSEL